jgi:hypothetical protein
MTKTNAQRQAEYRARHFKDVDGELERLNMAVPVTTKRRLERLATWYGVTQRALLEKVLEAEERKVLSGMTSVEQDAYYTLRRNGIKTQDKPSVDSPADSESQESNKLPHQELVTESAKQTGNSGFKGVSRHKRSGKWQAQVRVNGKPKHLGLFDAPELANGAIQAYHQDSCLEQ